jgi:hypothetical protein
MSIGYINTLSDAEDYFQTERGESVCWNDYAQSGDAKQKAVLTQAYNRLYYSDNWSLPDPGTVTGAQLKKLQMAQLETAYYLCCHLLDEDQRKGLQAQAVKEAGIVKEKYKEDMLKDLPFPPIVWDLLYEWYLKTGFHMEHLYRDETE